MNQVHVEAFDLNLLLAFDALWTERHVTRAGRRVGLTQSAMSHALRRLRAQLDDALFQPTPRGLTATPRAHALAPLVAEALALVRRAVEKPAPFSPAALERTFTVGSSDYSELALVPRLMARIAREAPKVRLIVRPIAGLGERELLAGAHDLVLTVATPPGESLRGEPLLTDGFVSLLRHGHPLARRPLTLARFVALDHVLVSPQGAGEAAVDVALRERGLVRRVALRIPHFLAAPFVIAETDYVITMPARVAHALAAKLRLVVKKPPVPLPGFTFSQFWHTRNEDDEAHRWLRALVRASSEPPARAA
jgi:DNA-binding transcriptional LysR family regulator